MLQKLILMPRFFKARSITKKANKLLSEGNYAAAKGLYLQLEDMKTVNYMIYHNIATIYFQEREWGKAEEYFKKCLSLQPHSAVSYSTLSEVYLRSRRWKEAEQAITEAVAIEPLNYFLAKRKEKVTDSQWRTKHVDALELTEEGLRLMSEQRFDDALNRFERAVLLDPDNATAHYCAATIYLKQRDIRKAAFTVSRAIELEPSNKEYAGLLAYIQQQARTATTKED